MKSMQKLNKERKKGQLPFVIFRNKRGQTPFTHLLFPESN